MTTFGEAAGKIQLKMFFLALWGAGRAKIRLHFVKIIYYQYCTRTSIIYDSIGHTTSSAVELSSILCPKFEYCESNPQPNMNQATSASVPVWSRIQFFVRMIHQK